MDTQFLSQLRKLFSPSDKWKFIGLSFLMALSASLELLGLGVLAGAVSLFLHQESRAAQRALTAFNRFLPAVTMEQFTVIGICSVFFLLIFKNLFALGIVALQARFINAKVNALTMRLFDSYLYADYLVYRKLAADRCCGHIDRIGGIGDCFLLPCMQLWADLLIVAGVAAASFWLLPGITISCVIFLALCTWLINHFSRKVNRATGKQMLNWDITRNRIRFSSLLGMETVRAFGKEEYFDQAFRRAQNGMSSCREKLYVLGQVPRLSLETAVLLLVPGIFLFMTFAGVSHNEILLSFTVIVAVLVRMLPALSRAHYSLTMIRQSRDVFESLSGELFSIAEVRPSAHGAVAPADGTIECRDLEFSYPDGKTIFSDFSLAIAPHECVGIAGASGRGKSTLLGLLLGFFQPEKGAITANGIPIAENPVAWRSQIGYVPQEPFLLEAPIRENVAFGEEPSKIDDERVRRALEMAQLPEYATDLNRVIASGGADFSGGQRQRFGIARALYRQPKLLLLDEATSALDPGTEHAFCEVLRSLRGQMTIVVVSHRESTLDICQRIVNL